MIIIKLNLDDFGLKLLFIRTRLCHDQWALSDFYIGNNVYLSIIYSLQQTAYPSSLYTIWYLNDVTAIRIGQSSGVVVYAG